MLKEVPAKAHVKRLTPDLQANAYYRWLNRNFLFLQFPLAAFLWWLGESTGAGGLALVLWGIPLRLVVVYHCTWMVNSATHRWGYVSHAATTNRRTTGGWPCSPLARAGITITTPTKAAPAWASVGGSSISPGCISSCCSASA